MSTYAIGDVQGCYAELRELLALIQFNPTYDKLWFVGDLVNRGPQSLETLRYVRSLGSHAITVLGNHDLHLLAIAFGREDRLKSGDTLAPILSADDADELLDWLRRRPLLHHDSELNYTMVHAGLAPQWDLSLAQACAQEVERALSDTDTMRDLFEHMYGNKPDRWSASLRGVERWRFIVNCFTRMRICDANGRLDLKHKGTLNRIPNKFFPWFKVPHRQSKGLPIVCGHWSALGYYDGDGILAIDTGCVWGERLCAVRLETREAFFVQSQQAHRDGD
jgi:bis(5'-nucleosyl)-tetraphosphatase (symmetrical)